jgi:putative membrane protein insertion efficiency factor
MKRVLILLIKGYQATLSRVLRPAGRFVPTCSEYMIECLEKKGVLRGLLKGTWRLLRCNPLFPGGYDPVEQDEQC